MNDLAWLADPCALPSDHARRAAQDRQNMLTKPPGALGRLEEVAIKLAALQGSDRPRADNIYIAVFAGDHGVTAEGVSAFPQSVTAEMVRNFSQGGAAISVLARGLGAELDVVDVGTVCSPGPLHGVRDARICPGTANFTQEPAMSSAQLTLAVDAGRQCVDRARLVGTHIFVGGEMGIGNTTAAAALSCALLNESPHALTGPGTGLDIAGVSRKRDVIACALKRHRAEAIAPLEALRRLGGLEIAALVGAYVACAQSGLPVLVDGFISTAAALAAERLCPGVRNWFLYSHTSAEPGHRRLLEVLEANPLLDLGMRLGEGSGAAVAMPLLRFACALHNDMATFAGAGVSSNS